MITEQKIEKLKGIADKKVAIWCDTEEKANEVTNMINRIEILKNKVPSYYNIGYLNKTCYNLESKDDGIFRYYCSKEWYEDEGYEVIPFDEFFKEEIKQLGDYTLREVKEYCEKVDDFDCDYEKCIFNGVCDRLVSHWDLGEPNLKLTEKEIELLKAIKLICQGEDASIRFICHEQTFELFNVDNMDRISFKKELFPSLNRREEYNINDLLKGIK